MLKLLLMIDFLKILVTDKSEIKKLQNDTRLNWESEFEFLGKDLETIQTKIIKSINGIMFCFYANKVEVIFKPHYYFNNNLHNANDFNVTDCIKTISVLNNFLTPLKGKVINIEFGVNFISQYGKEAVMFTEYHKKDQFHNDTDLRYSKKSFRTNKNGIANKYKIIKLYSKGLQFPEYCNSNTIRLEIKSKQSKYIRSLGIQTIEDLLNPDIYQNFISELIQASKDLLILDHNARFENLNKRDKAKLTEYLKNHVWYRSIQQSRNEFRNKKKRYFSLLDKTGFNIHKELEKSIRVKLKELIKKKNETCAYSTPNNKTKHVHIPQYI